MALSPPYDMLLLGAAALLAAGIASQSQLARQASVQVGDDLPKVFAQVRTGADKDCSLTDRGGATLRRSEPELTKTKWKCTWLGSSTDGGESARALAALSGDRPAFLFVPALLVDHPLLPAAYANTKSDDLPSMHWVQLYFDRTYRGLFLQVELAAKQFADDRHFGDVEMLHVVDDQLRCWDRKLRSSCPILASTIADSVALQPRSDRQSEILATLQRDVRGRSYLLRQAPTPQLVTWPLPFDLSTVLAPEASSHGVYRDRRFVDWSTAPTAAGLAVEDELLALDIEATAAELIAAVRTSCRITGCDPESFEQRLANSPFRFSVVGEPPVMRRSAR